MLDTKSKKMRNLKLLIITLTVLLPAVLLVALYPRMGQVYEQKIKEREEAAAESAVDLEEAVEVDEHTVTGTDSNSNTDTTYVLDENVSNEAVLIEVEDYLPNEQIIVESDVASENVEAEEHMFHPEEMDGIPVAEEELIISVESAPENDAPADAEYELGTNLVNYAIESSYYLYGQILQDDRKTAVDFSVLDYYGWINDYYTLADQCEFYVEYATDNNDIGSETETKTKTQDGITSRNKSDYNLAALLYENGHSVRTITERNLEDAGRLGYLTIVFDEYGNISDIRFNGFGNIIHFGSLYQHAKESISQYENNVVYYNQVCDVGSEVDPMELRPKNFKAVFVVDEDSQFTFYRMGTNAEQYHYNPFNVFIDMGAEWLILIAVIWVAIIAFILPFFKKLNTGWEKLFSIPAEIMCFIIAGACGGVYLMFEMMYSTCYPVLMESLSLYGPINIIGYDVAPDTIYYIALGVNFIGWALVFFLEYISVSAIRQFLFRPIYYLKTRVLCVRICRWLWSLCKRAYHYVTDINIGKGLNKSIWKIVIVNFLIVGVCCCFWFVGWIGVLIYSVILYVILRKFGYKLQNRYEAVLNVTKEMAEGNLKTAVPTDLGVFSELGEELTKVQTGFAKAVAEEAKSQNMKTELITNVSHDLKTPLTAIITYVDLLKKEDITEEERKEYVETLDKKSQRLKVLIEDLFEVSKASSNNITLYCTDMDLVNLLKQVCLENEDKIAESTLDFRWNLPEKKCVAYLDPNRTYRIMDNLIQNILKYSMPHSRVYIDMEETDSEYVLHFKNMSATEMNFDAAEITERFVRGDLSRNTEGSGLGLAIAQSFTEMQGGKFEVQIDGDLFKVNLRFNKKEE